MPTAHTSTHKPVTLSVTEESEKISIIKFILTPKASSDNSKIGFHLFIFFSFSCLPCERKWGRRRSNSLTCEPRSCRAEVVNPFSSYLDRDDDFPAQAGRGVGEAKNALLFAFLLVMYARFSVGIEVFFRLLPRKNIVSACLLFLKHGACCVCFILEVEMHTLQSEWEEKEEETGIKT